ncbi:hypothetical protein OFDDKENP_00196 [Aeromonas phage B614]|nr:hypothetical protein OFDDKENP_00196 [Aeromonas phage B614]UYD58441.1 hypothetical protein IPAKJDPM_00098 [Aeromonas phage avDM14-QBC]UYD58657.1 hypothetical protein HNNIDBEH_00064 [Aeromonas phage avDM10-HWA]UYD59040.1 hypothetical protein OFOPOMKI_00190 [Aeromonas phage avDM7-IJDJ]UYD59852.1 hypothetical protein LEHPIFIF_00079 [Aeromonas phage avDM9-HANS]
MEIEIEKKYRVIDATQFMPEHGIENGHEFTVSHIDDDGDLYSCDISWDGKPGDGQDAPGMGWALLLNGRNCFLDTPADYTGAIEEIE